MEGRQREAFAVLRHLWGEAPPLLYQGPPSKKEEEYLNHFLCCMYMRDVKCDDVCHDMYILCI